MRLLVLAFLACVLPGCFDFGGGGDDIDCAFNESYLQSVDADTMNSFESAATAVAGKQRFAGFYSNCGVNSALELRIATFRDPTLATAQIFNGVVTVTGVADGMTTLDTTDTMYGEEIQISVATINDVALSSPSFVTGTPFATILLSDRGLNPIVDDSLTVSGPLPLGDAWNHLAIGNATPGDYAETIHAGGVDWPVTVTVTP
jgi:hypothetical protein